MKLSSLWPQLLLLSGAVASPIQDAQQVLTPQNAPEKQQQQQQHQRKLQGRFLHITDFHPDQFYKVHTSTEEGIACHRGKGLAGTYGAEITDCDSPFSLVDATFDWINKHVKDDIDFVVWTGDTARHDSDEKNPRNSEQVLSTNRMVAKKFIKTFSTDGRLDIPVVPTFGNNDFLPHNIFYPGPNKWLRSYADIWKRFIPEAQRHSFEFGGWFWVEVVPNHLAVFSLNTMYFFDRNAGVDGCAKPSEPGFQHMEWLRIQLQLLRDRGMKAILIGHVPPARTKSKQNWDETCWQKYTLWLQKYRDVITGSLYGHMNIDHFLLQDTNHIDIDVGASEAYSDQPVSMDEGVVSIFSKEDYLHELRDEWSELPGSAIKELLHEDKAEQKEIGSLKKHKKRNKFKKIGGKHAERYQVSLISPSVVPNYFPTIRIFEYNITGLEESSVWAETTIPDEEWSTDIEFSDEEEDELIEELKRDVEAERKNKKNKKKMKKPKHPKDPNLVIPDDPPKKAIPGPAYLPQPFTLTGYTQYYANLTYLNNDLEEPDMDENKWRDGDHADDVPKNKKPKPHDFSFEVEYKTYDDDIFKLKDLTVMNYLKLAYRMGQEPSGKTQKKKHKEKKKKKGGKGKMLDFWNDLFDNEEDTTVLIDEDLDDLEEDDAFDHYDDDDDDGLEDASESGSDSEDDIVDAQKGKGKKKKKKKKHHNKNKTWVSFLSRAFVGTVPKESLKKS